MSRPIGLVSITMVDYSFIIDQSGFVVDALRHLHAAQIAAAEESRSTARQLSDQQQSALEKLTLAQAAANKVREASEKDERLCNEYVGWVNIS